MLFIINKIAQFGAFKAFERILSMLLSKSIITAITITPRYHTLYYYTPSWYNNLSCVLIEQGKTTSSQITPSISVVLTVSDCYGTELQCTDGTNTESPGYGNCYPADWQCDGVPDCSDGSDEEGSCDNLYCPSGFTRCLSG